MPHPVFIFFELERRETSGHLSFRYHHDFETLIKETLFLRYDGFHMSAHEMTRTIRISFPFYDTLGQPKNF